MISNKDYTQMPLEALLSEEKKMNSYKNPTALFIGFLIGIAVWSATHKGGFLTFIVLFMALMIARGHTQNLKRLQAEIAQRNAG